MAEESYAWQQECLDAWVKNEYHGIVQAVTGAGKTRLALAGIELLQNIPGIKLRVKIIVPGKSLLLQWKRSLERLFPSLSGKAGIYGGGMNSPKEQDYMIYVVNSARYRLARQILQELKAGYTVLLIADECHHYASGENQKIFEFLPFSKNLPGTYCSLGLSATPDVPGYDTILVPALGKKIYAYSLAQALRRGTVCAFAVWQIAISFSPKEQQEYDEFTQNMRHIQTELSRLLPGLRHCSGAQFFALLRETAAASPGKEARLARSYLQLSYKRKRTVYMAQARTDCVIRLLSHLDPKKPVLIFGESISQIEQLYTLLNQSYPARVGRYHSQMGLQANRNTLQRFQDGSLRILMTCRALDEGVDVPEAAVGIILSGTSMERQRMQRLGRLLRRHSGKRMACLYYLFVAGSQEERAYFPKFQECFQAENLEYDNETGDFFYPAYEKNAAALLQELTERQLPQAYYQEALACLERGYLREDWLLPSEECRNQSQQATGTRERNYWICMERMAVLRSLPAR